MSFSLGNLVFKDSCQFLQNSLDTLVGNLPKTDEEFKHTKALADEYKVGVSPFQRKGIYPYSWVDKFEITELPLIEAFHNDLSDEPCKKDDYEYAKRV